jgi:hypothetical protein
MNSAKCKPSPLCSALITITVGPEEIPFQVHKNVLTKTKYFRCCFDGDFIETTTENLYLPEDKPAVFANILNYIYFGTVPYPIHDLMIPRKDATGKQEDLVQETLATTRSGMIHTYIAAEKFGIEGLMNGIQDRYRKLNSRWAVTPDELGLLTAHGRQ